MVGAFGADGHSSGVDHPKRQIGPTSKSTGNRRRNRGRSAPGKVPLTTRTGHKTHRSRETAPAQPSASDLDCDPRIDDSSDSRDVSEQPLDEFGGLFEKRSQDTGKATLPGVARSHMETVASNRERSRSPSDREPVSTDDAAWADQPAETAEISSTEDTPETILDSLASAPVSRATSVMKRAAAVSTAALQAQRDEAERALPVQTRPLGATAGTQAPIDDRRPRQPATDQPGESLDAGPRSGKKNGANRRHIDDSNGESNGHTTDDQVTIPPVPSRPPLDGRDENANDINVETEPAQRLAAARNAQSALAGVSTPVGQLATADIEVPVVDSSGDADPGQLQSNHDRCNRQMRQAAAQAHVASRQSSGDVAIAAPPAGEARRTKPTLSQPRRPGGNLEPDTSTSSELPVEAMSSIDVETTPVLHPRIDAERQTYLRGKAQYDADSQASRQRARQGLADLEQSTEATQRNARKGAQSEVLAAREDWQLGIEHIQNNFHTRAIAAKVQNERQIAVEQFEGNRRAAQHIADAENKAEREKLSAQSEVARKKKAAKKKSKGFWGWARSKAKALVNGLRKAVDAIYDRVRKAIAVLFEAARELARAAVEAARMAIVALIKAHGAVLRSLTTVALAAFPALRDKIRKRIDRAVRRASDLVDRAANALKTGIATIIDTLASTIDQLLCLVQDLYNASLTVIGMIISGELQDAIRRMGHLIDAAKTAPDQFEVAAYEELMGGNLDQPLSSAELAAAGHAPVAPAEGSAMESRVDEIAMSDPEGESPSPPWTTDNVGVDHVVADVRLSPELSAELLQRTGGDGEIEFGAAGQTDGRSLDAILGTRQGHRAATATSGPALASAHVTESDGLTPRERAEVKWTLMKQGLARWWSENWPLVLSGGVLGAAGFIVANVLTGGAILAALPVIMTAVGAVFSGVMIAQLAGHLRDYLQKGWNGDIHSAGKSLAKGLAVGAIELISLVTFKAGGLALKGARAAARGVAKGARSVTRSAASVARRGAGYAVKGSKVILRGAGDAIDSSVRTLRELGTRLVGRTRFKGFRIRVANRRLRLEGRINPWILLAQGSTVEFAADELPALARQGDELVTSRGRGQILSMTDELDEVTIPLIDRRPPRSKFDERIGKLERRIEMLEDRLARSTDRNESRQLFDEIHELRKRTERRRIDRTYRRGGKERVRGSEDIPRNPSEASLNQPEYDELVDRWQTHHKAAADRRYSGMRQNPQGTDAGDWERYQHYMAESPQSANAMTWTEWKQLSARRSPDLHAGRSDPRFGSADRPSYGHAANEHGATREPQELIDRVRTTQNPQGHFADDRFIVEAELKAPMTPGEHVVNMGESVGCVYLPNGKVLENVQMVKVIRKADGTVKTAYPFA